MTPVPGERRIVLDADDACTWKARDFLRACCGELHADADTTDSAVLLTSELAANACQYAGTPVVVLVSDGGDRLHVEVQDNAPGLLAPGRLDDPMAESGRGLGIVDLVADTWGVRSLPQGKSAWFELDL